eukprot:CAMPEP_0175129796 /NCGR_PEP_ID=MMETSP0087-20121206/5664_1 /TAXON_ID=136419 /ORGANISM="Unknown Unknown, Strain D1" /LENGTH=187 /DNA_ID=CAMNT_0016411971 /DNA_START=200 /DNA_END=759 /DNA_ORIENTATION=+
MIRRGNELYVLSVWEKLLSRTSFFRDLLLPPLIAIVVDYLDVNPASLRARTQKKTQSSKLVKPLSPCAGSDRDSQVCAGTEPLQPEDLQHRCDECGEAGAIEMYIDKADGGSYCCACWVAYYGEQPAELPINSKMHASRQLGQRKEVGLATAVATDDCTATFAPGRSGHTRDGGSTHTNTTNTTNTT